MKTRHTQKPITLNTGSNDAELWADIEYCYNPGDPLSFDNQEDPEAVEIISINVNGLDFEPFMGDESTQDLQDLILCDIKLEQKENQAYFVPKQRIFVVNQIGI